MLHGAVNCIGNSCEWCGGRQDGEEERVAVGGAGRGGGEGRDARKKL